ncbi:MAG: acyltransferase [Rhizomicrobium sp.]|nr:acyltransferase [Rhizomicrobium sp.]
MSLPSAASDVPLKTTQHYLALDALRGLAALSVMIFHFGHWLHVERLAPNAGLAVDLFFCLSGFVMMKSYDRKLSGGLSFVRFMKVRLIRLMPLVMAATLISAIYVLFRIQVKHDHVALRDVATAVLLGLINLPNFGAVTAIGGPQIFPLNGPQYTLFLEVVVNIFWAGLAVLRGLRFALIALVLCSCVVGWYGTGGDVPDTFWNGFPRVVASFYAGVAVYHLRHILPEKAAVVVFPLCVAIMLALYYVPSFPISHSGNPIIFVWIVAISPLLVLSGAKVTYAGAFATKGQTFLGDLSYPLYVLHYPLFCWVNGIYQAVFKVYPSGLVMVGYGVFIVVASFVTLRLFDEPVRRWASTTLLGKSAVKTSAVAATEFGV